MLIEKNNKVGGLARSTEWDHSTVDIGSHAFRTEFTDVLEEVKRLCGNGLSVMTRKSSIWMDGHYITYPPEIGDLLSKVNIDLILNYALSYLTAHLKSIFLKSAPNLG